MFRCYIATTLLCNMHVSIDTINIGISHCNTVTLLWKDICLILIVISWNGIQVTMRLN